jgi:hypothetical protein
MKVSGGAALGGRVTAVRAMAALRGALSGSLVWAVCILLTLAAVPVGAFAQSTIEYTVRVNNRVPPVTFSLQAVYWMPSGQLFSVPAGGTAETWSSNLYGLDFRADWQSHWGFHFNGVTGNQGSWSFPGSNTIPLNGTDTVWSADVSYVVQRPLPENPSLPVTFRAFIGYGEAKENLNIGGAVTPAALTFDSTGGRVGFDFSYPFQSGWSLNAGLAYSPSLNTTVSSTLGGRMASSTVTGTGWDAQASVRYTSASRWNVELGYRFVQESQNGGVTDVTGVAVCPCHTQWQGPFGAIGLSF